MLYNNERLIFNLDMKIVIFSYIPTTNIHTNTDTNRLINASPLIFFAISRKKVLTTQSIHNTVFGRGKQSETNLPHECIKKSAVPNDNFLLTISIFLTMQRFYA